MHNENKFRILVLLALALCACVFATAQTNAADTNANDRNLFEEPTPDLGWPRILSGNGQSFTIYQPQLDSWDGFTLEAHVAVALATGTDQPSIFGVANLKVRTLVDKTDRLVSFEDLQVVDAKFPSAPEQEQAYTQALRDVLPKSIKSVSLDRLEAQLDIQAEQSKSEALPLQNAPPRIVFKQTPSVLLYIDGEPKYVPVEGTKLARVVNTRVLLLKDSKDKLYLHLLDGYMEASALSGPWKRRRRKPPEGRGESRGRRPRIAPDRSARRARKSRHETQTFAQERADADHHRRDHTDRVDRHRREAQLRSHHGTSLLFIKNTSANVFKLMTDQMTLRAHRRALVQRQVDRRSMGICAADNPAHRLRADPGHSPKENVKAAVPGTRQAQEALIANQIPTSARVDRKSTKFTLQTDGEPKLVPIAGTPLQYVLNASAPVIRVDDRSWYACQDGVWFVATAINGPWVVADTVPAVIYTIPPASPVYYVTYVRVYHATPTYVYVGYTPGYMGRLSRQAAWWFTAPATTTRRGSDTTGTAIR